MNHRLMDSKLINVLQGGNYDLLVYRGLINILLHKYDSAEYFLKIASNIEFNSSHMPHVRGLAYLALLYKTQGRIQEAEQTFKKAIVDHTELNSYQGKVYFNEAFFLYGNFLSEHHRYVEAEEQYQTINKNDYGCVFGFYGMATLRARQGKDKEALDWLEKALDWYFPRPEPIYNEPAFENIRKTKRFKAMMEKNFPLRWEN
jgi:tetratricopeptide (TPR) repeat protein